MKVIVCGGRDYQDKVHLFEYLDQFHSKFKITLLINGGASGADRLAYLWANLNQVKHSTYFADWKTYGKSAGMIRNKLMLEQKPDAVIAFPGGRGTANMVTIAKMARIKVYDGSVY